MTDPKLALAGLAGQPASSATFTTRGAFRTVVESTFAPTRREEKLLGLRFKFRGVVFEPGSRMFTERVHYGSRPAVVQRVLDEYVALRAKGMTPEEARRANRTGWELEAEEGRDAG